MYPVAPVRTTRAGARPGSGSGSRVESGRDLLYWRCAGHGRVPGIEDAAL